MAALAAEERAIESTWHDAPTHLRIDAILNRPAESIEGVLRALVAEVGDALPRPGGGATIDRWRALERVARHDLSLAKVFEPHVDALAILAEIDPRHRLAHATVYAVWASEARVDPLVVRGIGTGDVRVAGRKAWCSGAAIVDRALMTAVDGDGVRRLVDVALDAPGLSLDRSRWNAVGMRDSASFDVICRDVPARLVDGPDGYLARPGFWHGGAGIAACWYGGAAAIGARVRDLQRGRDDVHALAHLGAIDGELAAGAAALRECAATIDESPRADAARVVLRVRNAVADMAERVLAHAGRAIGPGPLCNEPDVARRFADLPVFVRQSRAEHDRVAQARALLADDAEMAAIGWPL